MGDLLFGIVVGIVAVSFNPLKILLLMVLGLLAGVLTTSILTSVKLLSFWLGDISNATQKYTHSLFITLTIYPEKMFPGVIRFVMYTAIPAAYVAHVPVKLMDNFSFTGISIMLIASVFFVSLMFFLYNNGLKKYESGNGVTRR
jgi:ABC-2 type transport system permease protein